MARRVGHRRLGLSKEGCRRPRAARADRGDLGRRRWYLALPLRGPDRVESNGGVLLHDRPHLGIGRRCPTRRGAVMVAQDSSCAALRPFVERTGRHHHGGVDLHDRDRDPWLQGPTARPWLCSAARWLHRSAALRGALAALDSTDALPRRHLVLALSVALADIDNRGGLWGCA